MKLIRRPRKVSKVEFRNQKFVEDYYTTGVMAE
jgi:hypothetical protein